MYLLWNLLFFKTVQKEKRLTFFFSQSVNFQMFKLDLEKAEEPEIKLPTSYGSSKWQPTPILLPGKSHGWRSLVGYSPRGHKELDIFFVAQLVKNPPSMQETWVRYFGWEDPLEK